MKQKYLLLVVFILQSIGMISQIGINNSNPNATLDVSGNVLVKDKLYLENPGGDLNVIKSKLLVVNDTEAKIVKYDIETSSYGPINYVKFVFKDISTFGLRDGYNTKISASKYTLAVHGYYLLITDDQTTDVSFRSTINNNERYMEGHQYYAYVENGEWWIKWFVNNSKTYKGTEKNVDIYMDVTIYRNDFITKKFNTPIEVDMEENTTRTVPTPEGF